MRNTASRSSSDSPTSLKLWAKGLVSRSFTNMFSSTVCFPQLSTQRVDNWCTGYLGRIIASFCALVTTMRAHGMHAKHPSKVGAFARSHGILAPSTMSAYSSRETKRPWNRRCEQKPHRTKRARIALPSSSKTLTLPSSSASHPMPRCAKRTWKAPYSPTSKSSSWRWAKVMPLWDANTICAA